MLGGGYVPEGNRAMTPLHYMLTEEKSGQVGFLHVSKHQFFLQVDTIIFNFSLSFCNISRKKLGMKLIFCMHHANIKGFNKLILSF